MLYLSNLLYQIILHLFTRLSLFTLGALQERAGTPCPIGAASTKHSNGCSHGIAVYSLVNCHSLLLKMAYSYLFRVDLLFLNMGSFSSSQTANVYKRLAERFFMILMTTTQNEDIQNIQTVERYVVRKTYIYMYILWLVVSTPLKNDGVRQLGWWNSQYMEKS